MSDTESGRFSPDLTNFQSIFSSVDFIRAQFIFKPSGEPPALRALTFPEQHLPLYLAEFDHRHNTRFLTDGERTNIALKKANGKRLTYQRPK